MHLEEEEEEEELALMCFSPVLGGLSRRTTNQPGSFHRLLEVTGVRAEEGKFGEFYDL